MLSPSLGFTPSQSWLTLRGQANAERLTECLAGEPGHRLVPRLLFFGGFIQLGLSLRAASGLISSTRAKRRVASLYPCSCRAIWNRRVWSWTLWERAMWSSPCDLSRISCAQRIKGMNKAGCNLRRFISPIPHLKRYVTVPHIRNRIRPPQMETDLRSIIGSLFRLDIRVSIPGLLDLLLSTKITQCEINE